MKNTSLSVEDRLKSDNTGEYAREIGKQLKQTELRLATEARKLHGRSTHEKIKAAETAVKSAAAVMQLFETMGHFDERK
ncbi:MAG: hypothetical protein LW731_08810 [Oxalobacteraceae bacterium]|jgi:hypothetical protein|nr:hypothetical protein [Oxalobacteraceae bacterium]